MSVPTILRRPLPVPFISLVLILAYAVFALPHLFPIKLYGVASDFRVFYSAAHIFWSGGNPYHLHHLQLVEQQTWRYSQTYPVTDQFSDAPILLFLFWPLIHLSYWAAFGVFSGVGLALDAWLSCHLLRSLGWHHALIAITALFLSWIGILALSTGQPDVYLLAILLGGFFLAKRNSPLLAGLLLGLFWIKPDILWPAVLGLACFFVISHLNWKRYLLGLTLTSVLCLLPRYQLLSAWLHQLIGFGHHLSQQADLASLPGLLAAAPSSWHLGTGSQSWVTLTVTALGVVAIFAFLLFATRSNAFGRMPADHRLLWLVALPLAIWLLCAPYDHPNDDILLLPLVLLVVGKDAQLTKANGGLIGILLVALLFCVFPLELIPAAIGLPVLAVAVTGLWLQRASLDLPAALPAAALLALVVFPALWPLRLLPVGVTSIAGLTLLVAALFQLSHPLGQQTQSPLEVVSSQSS